MCLLTSFKLPFHSLNTAFNHFQFTSSCAGSLGMVRGEAGDASSTVGPGEVVHVCGPNSREVGVGGSEGVLRDTISYTDLDVTDFGICEGHHCSPP